MLGLGGSVIPNFFGNQRSHDFVMLPFKLGENLEKKTYR